METLIQRVWTKSKLLIKGFVITVIILLLQIPAFYVKNLIEEREQRQKEAITEVSSKWASTQNIAGPVVALPFIENATDTSKKPTRHVAYFLPDELIINSTVIP